MKKTQIDIEMLEISFQEDIKKKPKLAALLATLSNYDVTIPASKQDKPEQSKREEQKVNIS